MTDDKDVATYVERWKKEVGREPNGLPYTQYLYDAPYIVRAVYKSLDDKKLPLTGENFRSEMLAIKTFDLPLTGKLVINNDTAPEDVFLAAIAEEGYEAVPTMD